MDMLQLFSQLYKSNLQGLLSTVTFVPPAQSPIFFAAGHKFYEAVDRFINWIEETNNHGFLYEQMNSANANNLCLLGALGVNYGHRGRQGPPDFTEKMPSAELIRRVVTLGGELDRQTKINKSTMLMHIVEGMNLAEEGCGWERKETIDVFEFLLSKSSLKCIKHVNRIGRSVKTFLEQARGREGVELAEALYDSRLDQELAIDSLDYQTKHSQPEVIEDVDMDTASGGECIEDDGVGFNTKLAVEANANDDVEELCSD